MAEEYQPFSIRQQFAKKPDIQLEEIDETLSTSIFNFIWMSFLYQVSARVGRYNDSYFTREMEDADNNFRILWVHFFNNPASEIARGLRSSDLLEMYDSLNWYNKYDFLEFSIYELESQTNRKELYQKANESVLEANNSGYRFINGLLEPITDKTSIQNLTKGAESKIDADHLGKALTELNKRKNRNTGQVAVEAMTGVESALKAYLSLKLPDDKRTKNATTGEMLSTIKKYSLLTDHSAYTESMSKLYGYLSDVSRHGQTAEDNRSKEMSLAEATYILEVCSAFVNYLKAEMQDGASK